MVALLNAHPSVAITHEADLLWILYQWCRDVPFSSYPWDGPVGMAATLERFGEYIDFDTPQHVRPERVSSMFLLLHSLLVRHGSAVQKPYPEKTAVLFRGDKKPVQHADPDLFDFGCEHLKPTRFLHLVRNPRMVVMSMMIAAGTWGRVPYWDSPIDELFDRWALHEERVLRIRAIGSPVLTVRWEDMCASPREETTRVLEFLGLDQRGAVIENAFATTRLHTEKPGTVVRNRAVSDRVARLMHLYGYE